MTPDAVVTRFAPSPTGFMHIGGVRTALYAYFLARKSGGTFILRIEDTDKEREVPGSIEHIMESLTWLGMEWDWGPDKPGPFGSCIQSQRLETYQAFARVLVEKGHAYPDPYTKEEIEKAREEAKALNRPFLYREYRPKEYLPWDGKQTLRFKVPEIKQMQWHDEVRGDLEAGPEALDDFVLMKSDGYPTYNFAHIVDDHHMGVTHILRSDEFIASMPKYLSLYDALGFVPPKFAMLPPILGEERTKKLSKRDGAKDVLDYRDEGYLPEAVANFLALIGWNPGGERELFTLPELVEAFDISGIQTAGGVANPEKLDWFNREYIKRLDTNTFWNDASPWLPAWVAERDENMMTLGKMEHLIRERIEKFSDIAELLAEGGELSYFFTAPDVELAKLAWKGSTPEKAKGYLAGALELLQKIPEGSWSADSVKEALAAYAEQEGRGNVLWPVRFALSGREKSADPFEIAAILGKDASLARIATVLS